MENFIEIAKKAKIASLKIAELDTKLKNQALNSIADAFEVAKQEIFEANKQDLSEAEKLVENGEITKSTFNRLKLDENNLITLCSKHHSMCDKGQIPYAEVKNIINEQNQKTNQSPHYSKNF